jgi:hypothetical protein
MKKAVRIIGCPAREADELALSPAHKALLEGGRNLHSSPGAHRPLKTFPYVERAPLPCD